MPGAAGQLKRLYQQIIGGTAPAGAASSSGDVSQMVKYLIDEMAKAVGATNISPSADTSGSLAERVAWLQANGGGPKKTAGGGYYVLPTGPSRGVSVVSSSSADTYGSWVELRAASGNALYIVGVIIWSGSGDTLYGQLDIGTGAASSESSISEVIGKGRAMAASIPYSGAEIILWAPIPVAANTRIAARIADSFGGVRTHYVSLLVIDQADLVAL